MIQTLRATLALAATLAFLIVSAGAQTPEAPYAQKQTITQLRVAWGYPNGHIADTAMKYWIDQVQKNKASNLTIVSYPAAQLYDDGTTLQGVVNGAVDVGIQTTGRLDKFIPAADVFDIPFLFKSIQSADNALSELTGTFNSLLEPKGAHILTWMHAGPVDGVATRTKQIRTAADVAGMKVRVLGRLHGEFIKELGGQPAVIPNTDTYLQLQTGALDGAFTNITGGVMPYKLYEVTKYYTLIPNSTFTMWAVEINMKTWRALTKAQQDALNQASAAAHKYELDLVAKQISAGPAELKSAAPSMVLYTVAPSDIPNWEKAARVVREAFAKDVGPTGDKILAQIDAAQRSASR